VYTFDAPIRVNKRDPDHTLTVPGLRSVTDRIQNRTAVGTNRVRNGHRLRGHVTDERDVYENYGVSVLVRRTVGFGGADETVTRPFGNYRSRSSANTFQSTRAPVCDRQKRSTVQNVGPNVTPDHGVTNEQAATHLHATFRLRKRSPPAKRVCVYITYYISRAYTQTCATHTRARISCYFVYARPSRRRRVIITTIGTSSLV